MMTVLFCSYFNYLVSIKSLREMGQDFQNKQNIIFNFITCYTIMEVIEFI